MENIYVIPADRRIGKPDLRKEAKKNERRYNKSLLRQDLEACIEIQKWKHESLLKLIDNKERKKFLITNVSFGVFAVLCGLVTGISTLLSKYGADTVIAYALYLSLLIVVIGVNLINLSVINYIASLKSEVLLAIRQLNCLRQSLHSLLFMLIHGKNPDSNFKKNKGNTGNKDMSIYFNLIGQHVKYPFDNETLRSRYLKMNEKGEYKNDYRALYRSADLFVICSIILFTLCLTIIPTVLFFYNNYHLKDSFASGASFIGIALIIITGFLYAVRRIIKSFFSYVIKPLIPD